MLVVCCLWPAGCSLPYVEGLRSLTLCDNRLSQASLVELYAGLLTRTSLTKLDVSHNALGGSAAMAALMGLLHAHTTIEELNVSKGGLRPEVRQHQQQPGPTTGGKQLSWPCPAQSNERDQQH